MNLIGLLTPTFVVQVLVAHGVGGWYRLGLGQSLASRIIHRRRPRGCAWGGAPPVLAVALAIELWAASFIWGPVIAWKVNKQC